MVYEILIESFLWMADNILLIFSLFLIVMIIDYLIEINSKKKGYPTKKKDLYKVYSANKKINLELQKVYSANKKINLELQNIKLMKELGFTPNEEEFSKSLKEIIIINENTD